MLSLKGNLMRKDQCHSYFNFITYEKTQKLNREAFLEPIQEKIHFAVKNLNENKSSDINCSVTKTHHSLAFLNCCPTPEVSSSLFSKSSLPSSSSGGLRNYFSDSQFLFLMIRVQT